MTFGFSTLCTEIPHNKLLKFMSELIDFCFDGGGKTYVIVTKYGAKCIPYLSARPMLT